MDGVLALAMVGALCISDSILRLRAAISCSMGLMTVRASVVCSCARTAALSIADASSRFSFCEKQ